jgi:tripartite ATP-independent transporter DctM subunit
MLKSELHLPVQNNRSSYVATMSILAMGAEYLCLVALILSLGSTFANTIARYVFQEGIEWSEDLSSIAMAIITFVGGPAYFRRGYGMAYTAVVEAYDGIKREILFATGTLLNMGFCIAILCVFPTYLKSQAMQTLPVTGLSSVYVAIFMPIGFLLLLLFGLEKLLRVQPRAMLMGLAVLVGVATYLIALKIYILGSASPLDPLLLLLPVILLAFLTAVPMAMVLALGGMYFLFTTDSAPIVATPAIFQAGVSSFLLVAIPYFLLAGVLMEVTGMAKRLIDMVLEWLGHWRGGLLFAQVISMYIFSGMSGSKAADVATVGSVMKGSLKERGYAPSESVAVLAAAAAMGEVIPPSIALLILGSITTLSVGNLFIAGIAPAAFLAVALMVGIFVRGKTHVFPKGSPFNLIRALRSIPASFPALMVPVIVLGGIVGGVASATESSSLAVVYGFLVAILVYRSLDHKLMIQSFRDAAVTSGMVLLMLASANLMSQAIVIDGLGQKVSSALAGFETQYSFLFVSMFAVIVLGFILEGFPAILITAPLLMPIAIKHGIDPLYFGILLTMAVGIGVFMPPIGIGYYMACAVGEADPHDALKPSLFYNVFLIVGLILCILFPEIILFLPHMLN